MNSGNPADGDLLQELLLRWEELYERGQDTPAAELAKGHPELIAELTRLINALKAVSWVTKPLVDSPASRESTTNPSRATGKVLGGRYRLEELVAEGGFAEVYKAYDTELQRIVALKIPKRSHLSSAESFLAEARRVARLKHDGIVPVYDVGSEGDTCFIVSEFLEGGSLANRLTSDKPTAQQALLWITEIADALEYAHQQGIVHRDIKPANILINAQGRAKLADFGIAQSITKTVEAGPSLGTLRYMSPELLGGKPADHRSDLYSLGVVLYEALTGLVPFSSDEPSVIRREIVEGRTRFPKPVPKPLAVVITKALNRSPHLRQESAKDFAEALRRAAAAPSISKTHLGWAILVGCLSVGALVPMVRLRRIQHESNTPDAPPTNAAPQIPSGQIAVSGIGSDAYLAGSVPGSWHKDGVFAEITSPGTARFPRLPETAYVLEADLTFHRPRGRISMQIGEPNCNVDVSMGDLWPQDRDKDKIAVRLFRGQPFGINWSGETHWETGKRISIAVVVADDLWALCQNGQDILRVTGEPTDFCLRIVAEGDPSVTIHHLACRALTQGYAQQAVLPAPQRTLSCDVESAQRLLTSQIGENCPSSPEPENDFALNDYLAMRWIDPGEFRMGSPRAAYWEMGRGTERVRISRGYWIGKYEVSQGQWQDVMGDNPSRVTGSPFLPVNFVSWSDARRFCGALNDRERAAGRLPEGYEYRLPTEAEWEYASRAGTDQDFIVPLKELAYRGEKYPNIVEIGTTPANPWGLHETVCNVSEWSLDQWRNYSTESDSVITDRFHEGNPAESPYFALKGHGWWFSEGVPSLFNRFPRHNIAGGFRGFRVALGPVIRLRFSEPESAQAGTAP
jgi:serine/threonine protein kinase/formylglycine-generating enzyme required for sulfatase activity